MEQTSLDRLLLAVGKPARYTGNEWNAVHKSWADAALHVALAYPDTYEVGMSNLGLQILYDIVNRRSSALCERVFAPWPDMEAAMRAHHIPLCTLESRRPLAEFDVIGFSLPYELNLTNVLSMLDLAGLPIHADARSGQMPLVIAGGSGAYHPEPMVEFIDAFVVGEGEEVILEIVDALAQARALRLDREDTLRQLARVPGVYIPRFYRVTYTTQGQIADITPVVPEAQMPVMKRVVDPLPPAPTTLLVPYVEAVHDRGMVEIMRGCTQGCRFCQAGMIYRPLRERSKEEIVRAVEEIVQHTGYAEVGLVSLSSADHSQIKEIVDNILGAPRPLPVSVTLPSLRTDAFSVELARMFQGARRSGLTFAPEAGSQRLRDVINKKVTEQDLLLAAEAAYANRWQRVKLYFMIGLPTETDEDVEAIIDLVQQVARIGSSYHGKKANVSVSVSTFVPKPHTPFQWHPLVDDSTLRRRQRILKEGLRGRSIHFSYHEARDTLLEAVLSRGDRRLGRIIEHAWRAGAQFDAWTDQFQGDAWTEAFAAANIDPQAEACRERARDEILPWDHISCGVDKAYLWREFERALQGRTTPDCREGCTGCGARETLECRGAP